MKSCMSWRPSAVGGLNDGAASADYTTVKESFPELAFLGYLTPEEW